MTHKLLPTFWTMHVNGGGFYPIQPSEKCTPEAHAALNDHIIEIRDANGAVLWKRAMQ